MLLLLRLPCRNHVFTRKSNVSPMVLPCLCRNAPRHFFCHAVARPLPSVAMPFDVMNMFSRCFLCLGKVLYAFAVHLPFLFALGFQSRCPAVRLRGLGVLGVLGCVGGHRCLPGPGWKPQKHGLNRWCCGRRATDAPPVYLPWFCCLGRCRCAAAAIAAAAAAAVALVAADAATLGGGGGAADAAALALPFLFGV